MHARAKITSLAAGTAILCGVSGALALEVKLQVRDGTNTAREPAAIASGVPFGRGELKDVSRLAVSAGGQRLPAQFTKTVPWDDGSVRWALMETQVGVAAGGTVELLVTDGGGSPAPTAPVTVEDGSDAVTLSTAGLRLVLPKKQAGFIRSLTVDGKELITAGKGLVIVREDGGEVAAAAPARVEIESAGPMRATVCLRGKFAGLHNDLLRYTARVTVLAGQKRVQTHLWIENHGADGQGDVKPEWLPIDGMAVDLGLGLGAGMKAACEGVESCDGLEVLQRCIGEGRSPIYGLDDMVYTIASKGTELKKGARTDGVVTLEGANGRLTLALRDFWQQYDKKIAWSGDRLRLWLWPTEGEWPRSGRNLEHEQIRRLKGIARKGLYMFPGSVHKGHEFVLDFSGAPVAGVAAELSSPLFARAEAQRYAATGALPALFAPQVQKSGSRELDFKLASWARMNRVAVAPAHSNSIFAARQEFSRFNIGYFADSSQWYGWMDFGDICVPGRGMVSLHYDWTLLILLEYLRNGEPASFRLASEMARHRVDIDQYWSDRDPPDVNRIQRGTVWPTFHANGRSGGPGQGSTHIAGLALWYMLTGEPKAREAALRSAEGLAAAWEQLAGSKVYGGGLKVDMAANGWTIESFCAAYDLTADRRWLDEALKLFDANVIAKSKVNGPHLHAAGSSQIFGQGYIKDDLKYCHVIAPLCLLHDRTGEPRVLELLVAGCDTPFPGDSHFEAPMFVAGLFGYTGLVTDNADYLKRARNLFAAGFPESREPPVFLPDNSTWSADAATTLRAGNIMAYVVWKDLARKDATP